MKSIVYIIPYFGNLPSNFQLVLESMRFNPTVNWLIFTDDKTEYDYPTNVKVVFCSFMDIKKRIQEKYDFDIYLEKPWDLCDFKVAYGEVFSDYISDYDYWGYCDLDMMFGDIRAFITDDLLCKYKKIGYQGHSTIFENSEYINSVYKARIDGIPYFRNVFSENKSYCFDENGITDIFTKLHLSQYTQTNFAHLDKFSYGFFLRHLPKEEAYKNEHNIFVWDSGKLIRYYLDKKQVKNEEYMYIHFWCRPMTYTKSISTKYLIFADKVVPYHGEGITEAFVKRYSRNNPIVFYIKAFIKNRKKITLKKIIKNIKIKIKDRSSKGALYAK